MEYYSAFKKKEILTDATTCIYFDEIMLREINLSKSQKQKVKWRMAGAGEIGK
jgi:hypothetical protein